MGDSEGRGPHFICNLVQILVHIFAGSFPASFPKIPSITRCTPCTFACVRICTYECCRQHQHRAKIIPGGHKKYLRSDQRDDYQKLPVISLGSTPSPPQQGCPMAELFMKLCALIPHVTWLSSSSPRQKQPGTRFGIQF